jgi:hypothetical protein
MRTTLMGLVFAGVLGVVGYGTADAMPLDTAAMSQAALSASTVQQVDYLRRTRHGYVRCYWDIGWGRTVCHRYNGYYGWWWW